MAKNQIDKAYDLNKVIWHRRNRIRGFVDSELHHIFGRTGISKCCLHLFARGKPGHTDNFIWVNGLRESYRKDYNDIKKQYIKTLGCSDPIYNECLYCKMKKHLTKEKKSV